MLSVILSQSLLSSTKLVNCNNSVVFSLPGTECTQGIHDYRKIIKMFVQCPSLWARLCSSVTLGCCWLNGLAAVHPVTGRGQRSPAEEFGPERRWCAET